jgi:hypothetical protein
MMPLVITWPKSNSWTCGALKGACGNRGKWSDKTGVALLMSGISTDSTNVNVDTQWKVHRRLAKILMEKKRKFT